MIGLSPLSTAHPNTFQRVIVRSSIPCYRDFNLAMDSSLRFRVCRMLLFAHLRLAFAAATEQNSLTLQHTTTRWLIMQKARGDPAFAGLPQIVSIRFQVLFHSPLGVLFTFPSRYWFTIGHGRVFSLRRWSSWIPTGFLVSRSTWEISQR